MKAYESSPLTMVSGKKSLASHLCEIESNQGSDKFHIWENYSSSLLKVNGSTLVHAWGLPPP